MEKIRINVEDRILTNIPSSDTTLNEILAHIAAHVDLWHDRNIIWDMRDFNFVSISIDKLEEFISSSQEHSQKREGFRTAILVNDELGFEKMTMFSKMALEHYHFQIKPFRELADARLWVAEGSSPNSLR